MDHGTFLAEVDRALETEDLDLLGALADQIVEGPGAERPFAPNLRLAGVPAADPAEAQVAMAAANGWARAWRLIAFRRRIRAGYAGPILVSEGDSWFQYPVLLRDVIDNLMEPFAVHSLGAAGDTLANMLAMREYREAIASLNADVFLFSASGNDVLGGGDITALLHRFAPGMEVGDVLRSARVAETLDRIEAGYDTVIRDALSVRPQLRILIHGYDRPVPRRDGQWLGGPMAALGIPAPLQAAVAGHLIDLLNGRLARFEQRFPGRVAHVDCRGRVGAAPQSWYDELHPRNPGYARVAAQFEAQIRAGEEIAPPVAVRLPEPGEPVTPLDLDLAAAGALPPEEAILDGSRPSGTGRCGLLSRLDREILEDYRQLVSEGTTPATEQDKRLRARRHMVPVDDELAFERILGTSNLFPVNFLSRGARKARAVAKIQLFVHGEIPVGSGSGFLVAPGLLLTNNHVIGSRDAARRARAVFDFQDDDDFQPMPTAMFRITDDLFYTSDRSELDFTFVSVRMDNEAGDDLAQFGHLALIEESGKAVKGEPVSIIQHPRGEPKSIALRDSRIIGVRGAYIYYSTDTEPGSSGAPVLNDQWLPVALHHRSVPDPEAPGRWIANRGIRISQIFQTLREAAAQGDAAAATILRLVGGDLRETLDPLAAPRPPERPKEDRFVPDADRVTVPGLVGTAAEAFPASRWDGVAGYDPEFLGQRLDLPLPPGGAGVREVAGRPDLPYTHFSVVMHADRRLAMVTAANLDGLRLRPLPRSGDWRVDPRIPRDAQVDESAYRANAFDRGHLVRRLTPMWGSEADARAAMADTFHYTVCAPQHARLNQGIWLELEDHLRDWAERRQARLSIFTGPLFRADDPLYRGIVRVPADYWKIAVADGPRGLRAVGYLHSQKNLVPGTDEAFGAYRTHRVPIHVLGELSGLDLSALAPFDVAAGGFEARDIRVVEGPEDIGL